MYFQDPEVQMEGVGEPNELAIQKAPIDMICHKWTQTMYTKKFQPLKKSMRDFMLKQNVIDKQMEKFYLTALYKRGIFGR